MSVAEDDVAQAVGQVFRSQPRPDTYWFYYLGQSTKHDNNVPGKVRHGAGVGRFLVQILDRGA